MMKNIFLAVLIAVFFIPRGLMATNEGTCDAQIFAPGSQIEFKRTYENPTISQLPFTINSKKQTRNNIENNVLISYEDFLNHLSSEFMRINRVIAVSNTESIPMNVKEIRIDSDTLQTWEMPNIYDYPPVTTTQFSQFDGDSHAYRDSFPRTEGEDFIYTQHGVHSPTTNHYEFYEIEYYEPEDLGSLVFLGNIIETDSEPQALYVQSELAPVPAEWGRSTEVWYDTGSTDPAVDYISVHLYVEVVAFGTLTTFDDGEVEAVKIHNTVNTTIYYREDMNGETPPPTSSSQRQIWWYSKQGHYVRALLKPNAPWTGMTSFQTMHYSKLIPSTLAVEWSDFSAQVNNRQQVALTWRTATEQDNSHFIIQRSSDGRTFSKIGEQASKGNSTAIQSYDFTDKKPVVGTNYYHIQQVDMNGKSTFSEVITAIILEDSEINPTVVLYPNPGKDEVWFSQPADYELFDDKGRLLTSGKTDGVVDVSGLPAGAYFVRINGEKMLSWVKN